MGKIVCTAVEEYDRVDQEAGNYKEDRDEKRISKEFQLLSCRLVVNRRVDRQSGQECSDYARQIDGLNEQGRHCKYRKHQDENTRTRHLPPSSGHMLQGD